MSVGVGRQKPAEEWRRTLCSIQQNKGDAFRFLVLQPRDHLVT